MFCPEGEAEEKPPPTYDSIWNAAYRMPAQDDAPWLDEESARQAKEVIQLSAEIERLEDEIKTLEKETEAKEGEESAPSTNEDSTKTVAQESMKLEATAYTAYCEGCSGITYDGHDLRSSIYDAEGRRVVAVDPSVISIGTELRVIRADGSEFRAIALDIGGDIKGNRIDIATESKEEAMQFGRQSVDVEIIK